jgi:putative ABC transport system ATP-binding protein
MSEGTIVTEKLSKVYNIGKRSEFYALKDVDMRVEKGELAAIMGPSGSGKSTLLNLISCLDTPTSGKVYLEGVDVGKLSEGQRARIRREKIGFVFQQFNLMKNMTAYENIELPMKLLGLHNKERHERVKILLKTVGLESKGNNKANELSGGEQQRIAIARSLANQPNIILADEPTGNLDKKSGENIINLLLDLNKKENKTIVIITHDAGIAAKCRRVIRIEDGKII